MNNRLRNISFTKYGYGFSLIELMVALVIGMLVTLVISQTLSVYEGRKRTTSGTADAQTSGSLALYALQRDAEMAGFAMPNIAFNESNLYTNPNYSALKCNTTNYTETTPVAVNTFPATIVSGADSDTVTIRYGNSPFGGLPTSLLANFSGNSVFVDNTMGCKPGDSVLIIPASSFDCLMTKIPTFAENGNTEPIATNSIALTMKSAPVNPPTVPAKLFCLGSWREFVFRINTNKLERNGQTIGNDIIALKAQYGVSGTAADNKIVEWKDGTFTDKTKIKSIRVALLARNSLYEKDEVTSSKPTYFDGTEFNVTGEWKHYRYRVFETIIPLRNVVWSREAIQ